MATKILLLYCMIRLREFIFYFIIKKNKKWSNVLFKKKFFKRLLSLFYVNLRFIINTFESQEIVGMHILFWNEQFAYAYAYIYKICVHDSGYIHYFSLFQGFKNWFYTFKNKKKSF